jgi:hypothetical protein
VIEQALYGSHDAGGYRFLARSPGFRDDWLPEAELLCTRFGERPAGVSCPAAVFARPFAQDQVAIVQVADQGMDDAGRPGLLGFRLLVLPSSLYANLGGDPFHIAEQFPPPWHARDPLPVLDESAAAPPPRTVESIQKIINVPYSATLLGGVQALLDGRRLVFERSRPDTTLVRGLWALLPADARTSLWPASFAFRNKHQFDAVVTPRAEGDDFAGYLVETQAGDYPEGRYELSLQAAAEAGDQQTLDALLAGRRRKVVVRLAAALLAVLVLSPLGIALLYRAFPRPQRPEGGPAHEPARAERLKLPPVEECPALTATERARLATRLQEAGERFQAVLPRGSTTADLTDAIAALDAHLGTPDPRRDPGVLRDLGPLQRQLRALLWKQGVAGYDTVGLNPVEMIEKLEKKRAPIPRKE